jgi:hypothetical protein
MSTPETPTLEPGPALFRAIENMVVARNHLAKWLKPDHPPATAGLAVAFAHYHPKGTPMDKPSAAFDLWVGWAASEVLLQAWTGKPGAEVMAVVQVAGEVGDAS